MNKSLLESFQPFSFSKEDICYVAYSGGLDSTVLLHFLKQQHYPVHAIHINHQLQSQSTQWAEHCAQQCKAWNIPCTVKTVDVNKQVGESLESAAREARYAVFKEILVENSIICTAHHQDDQAETLLLQLLRGSGVAGLAAMPVNASLGKGYLCRPFLSVSRASLHEYAINHGLKWIEDPSNEKTEFDRNYIRHEVMPVLQKRWPSAAQTLSRSAEHCAQASDLITECAEQDYALTSLGNTLLINACLLLSDARQKQLLRYWLVKQGFSLPSTAQLKQLREQLLDSREDAQPLIRWGNVVVRRYQDQLFAEAHQEIPDLTEITLPWDLKNPLILPAGLGRLEASHSHGKGLSASKLSEAPLSIHFRSSNGERCQPVDRAHSQVLKKLFQEYAIPPWKRSQMPLLYCGDTLACVVGGWICKGFEANEAESSILIEEFPSI